MIDNFLFEILVVDIERPKLNVYVNPEPVDEILLQNISQRLFFLKQIIQNMFIDIIHQLISPIKITF